MGPNSIFLNKTSISLFITFLVGVSGILCVKLYMKPVEVQTAIAVTLPILLLVSYCIFAATVSGRIMYESIGDNCYYLGFVFTLISLAVTLAQFYHIGTGAEAPGSQPPPSPQIQDEIQKAISGFGIALSSTIAGIVLRVLMLQATPEPAQKENTVRMDLDLTVREFRTHLRMSIEELKRFSNETALVMAELRDGIQNTLVKDREAYEKAREAHTDAVRHQAEDAAKIFADYRATLEEFTRQDLGGYREAMQKAVGDYRAHFEASVKELKRFLDETARAMVELRGGVQDALVKDRKALEMAREAHTDAVRRQAEDAAKIFADYRTTLEEFTRQDLDGYREAMQKAVGDYREHLGASVTELKHFLNETARAMAELRGGIQNILAKDREALEKARKAHTDAARLQDEDAAKIFADYRAALEEFTRQDLGDYREAMQKAVGDYRAHLEASVEDLKRFSNETARTMTELRDGIQKALEGARDAHADAMRGQVEDAAKIFAAKTEELLGSPPRKMRTSFFSRFRSSRRQTK